MKVDPKEYALRALDVAKEDLRRDKYLIPVAFITETEALDFTIDFGDVDQKALAYARLVDIAKEKNGRVIITLNDAVFKDKTAGGETAQDCIYVTASGSAMETWTVTLPYVRVGDEFHFGQPTESSNDFLSLLRGWPNKQPAAS